MGSGAAPMHRHGSSGTCPVCRQIRPLQGGAVKAHKQLTK